MIISRLFLTGLIAAGAPIAPITPIAQQPEPNPAYSCGFISVISFSNRDEYTRLNGYTHQGKCYPALLEFPGGSVQLTSDNFNDCEYRSSDGETVKPGKSWQQCLDNANAPEYTRPQHSRVVEVWGF